MEQDFLRRAEEGDFAGLIAAASAVRAADGPAAAGRLYAAWIVRHGSDSLVYAALFNLAADLSEAGAFAEARETLVRAIALKPDFAPARIQLGRLLERQGDAAGAMREWAQAAAAPGAGTADKVTALNQIARVMEEAEEDDTAETALRLSAELDPGRRETFQHLTALRQRQCEWPALAPFGRIGRNLLADNLAPLSAAAYADDPMMQLANAWHYNRTVVGDPPADQVFSRWPAENRADAPLRIGYLSSGLRAHATGRLMAEIFGLHDRRKAEVFVYYSGGKADDPFYHTFRADADRWTDIAAMGDGTAAKHIAADGIQILVDLDGYTRGARTRMVALRPAPVIANWLGYPGSMATPYHHYLIADEWIVPPKDEIYYSEKVVRLPCYQPTDRHRAVAARRPTRAEAGLPEDAVVYCSFNGSQKISRPTFERWLAVLKRVPKSVLWQFGGAPKTEARLRAYAGERGIAPARLVFAPPLPNSDHLARYPLADLFLDSLPYGAHTTASDALWMGVPVLTVSGRAFAARVCGSLVRAAGLPELVCSTPEDFVERAAALGHDPAALKRLKARLAAKRKTCVLFDTPLLVRRLEDLYAGMWRDFKTGRMPKPNLANMDAYFEIAAARDYEGDGTPTDCEGWWREEMKRYDAGRPLIPDGRFVGGKN